MKTRLTFTCLRSGQPRAYTDTEYVHQMLIEHNKGDGWFPLGAGVEGLAKTAEGWPGLVLDSFIRYAKAHSGWTDDPGPFDSTLDYFKQIGPGLIEWRVTTRYDD